MYVHKKKFLTRMLEYILYSTSCETAIADPISIQSLQQSNHQLYSIEASLSPSPQFIVLTI
jgi:hypothetical protein